MKRMTSALVAFAIAGAVVLTGCSSNGGGQSGQSGQSGDNTTAGLALQDLNLQPRENLKQGGTLRLAITALPEYYNQFNVNGNNADFSSTNTGMGIFILPQNWIYQGDGSFEANPAYVESYTSEEKDGKQVVNMKLNPKAVWGDGTAITVADYQATWKACNGKDTEFICASTDGFSSIESVEQGENEYDLNVTYSMPFPDWSAALSTVGPAAGMSDADTFNNGWTKPNNDWFTGPYQISSVDDAQKVVTLVPNPKWWGETPMLDTITFRAMDSSATATAFANSEIDVLSSIIDGEQYAQTATRTDAVVRRAGGVTWRHFTFNGENAALSDAAVRQALVRGIDRAAIANADLAGIPDLDPNSLLMGNHLFMPGQEGYQDNGTDYAYDAERAKSELDGLGWVLADGSEYRAKDGKTLEFDYAMMPDISTSKTEGEMLQSQMKEIGVKVNIVNVSPDKFFSDTVLNGKFGVTAFGWVGTPYPLQNIGQLYACDSIAPEGSNFTRTCVKEIDELIPQVASETDPTKRNELANEVDKLIWENVMYLPIYRRMEMVATPTNLANYGAFGMSTVAGENVGYTAQ